jgi:hypothetical protein
MSTELTIITGIALLVLAVWMRDGFMGGAAIVMLLYALSQALKEIKEMEE